MAVGSSSTKVQTAAPITGPTFARHESFHPRFGWLKKGFDKASIDSSLFLREDAAVILGVGKNMVRAIRYWCNAFKVLDESNDSKARVTTATQFGSKLLEADGWDPFLETDGALWLLHWYLLSSPCQATTWEFVFSKLRQTEFTADDLLSHLTDYVKTLYASTSVAESSLKNDISCLLRMYGQASEKVEANEETIVCPFVSLGLIEHIPNSKIYAFRIGAKPTLPPEIVVAACLQYAHQTRLGQKSINLSHLLYDHLSPGQCFKLTESSLYSALEAVAIKNIGVLLSDTAGIAQLQFQDEPQLLAERLLDRYFRMQHGASR